MIGKLKRLLLEAPIEIRRVLRGWYPDFVTSDRVSTLGRQVPVFMFHSDPKEVVAEQLAYLADNGYRSLRLSEFMAFLNGELDLKAPSVVLSWDDGDRSWFRDVYPLLKRFGFCGIGFVVTSRIAENTSSEEGPGWLSWEEIRQMEAEGVMDIQSHGHLHNRVFVTDRVVDFFRPETDINPLHLDLPWVYQDGRLRMIDSPGAPLFDTASALSDWPMFLDNEHVRTICIDWAAQNSRGMPVSDMGRRLRSVYREASSRFGKGRFESLTEQRQRIAFDLAESRKTLADRLGKQSDVICLPYGEGGRTVVETAMQQQWQGLFWVCRPDRRTNRPGDSPWFIPRLKNDYIFRLPGRGRKSLPEIWSAKWRRRMARNHIY
ncbi:polysaccharide deacetylase family protein [Desulfatirhabdium butyrativorans]|uniref:polysaccharide deacetylase family protein n=1 Tax=Desulfatirhabdium butyrativorans TaxID=340467 RepID=UPI000417909F|nr:polysaccharide deacetylase family protein [Desulfatirhabdium butyrativorans]